MGGGTEHARSAEKASILPVKSEGMFLGFDLSEGKRLVAPVRFSSNRLITAARVEEPQGPGRRLRFSGFKAKDDTGMALAANDFVEVALPPGEAFPEVRFRVTVADFNAELWEKHAGRFPFHFLATSMPEAEAVHQRGWLNATPKADPFPMLLDTHVGSPEIASEWSRNWSYTVPIGAYPIPVIGLWAPSAKLYVGYDFLASRLAEQSERYIAASYCWHEGADRQFITLAYPYAGRGFQTLTYPKKGSKIEGRFRLVYSTNMPSTADPNTFLQEDYFRRYADRLPRVPPMNDLGWMPGGTRLQHLPGAPRGRLIERSATAGQFDALSGDRIAARPGFSIHDLQRSETDNVYALPVNQAPLNQVENQVDVSRRIAIRHASVTLIDHAYQIGLSHASTPFGNDCKRKKQLADGIPFRFSVESGYQTDGIPARVKRLHRKSLRPSQRNLTDYDSFDSFVLLLPVPKSANSARWPRALQMRSSSTWPMKSI